MWIQMPGSVQKVFTYPDPGKIGLDVTGKFTGYKHTEWIEVCS